MKYIKRTFFAVFILMVLGLAFRGWIFRRVVTYQSLGQRGAYAATAKKLTDYIDTNTIKQTTPDIEQVIRLGLSITAKQLNFTANKNDNDPNKLINSRTAHCVGYASFFATTCNYLLKKYNLSEHWTATPQIGQLYFLGENMHKYFHSPFFKDHDFVIIKNKNTGEIYAVDPTVKDYLGIDFVSYSK